MSTIGDDALGGLSARLASPAALCFAWLLAWMIAGWGSAASLPYRFPLEPGEEILDTMAVGALLLPVAVSSIALDEGPHELVRGAARSLALSRFIASASPLVINLVVGFVIAAGSALPSASYMRDITVLWSMQIVGVALLRVSTAWIAPTLVLVVFSAPGLVPVEWNVLYAVGGHHWLAGTLLVSSVALFVRRGALSKPE